MHHVSKHSVHRVSRTEGTLIFVGVLSVILLFCGSWYYHWVKPNDERIERIHDCMFIERTNSGHSGLTPHEEEMHLYTRCSEKVAGK